MPFCLVSRLPDLQEVPRRTRISASYAFVLQHCIRRFAVASNAEHGSHGSTVATLSGLQLATLSSVPVSTLVPSGNGATVGPARVVPSAPSNHWIPPVFGKVCGDLKSDNLKTTLQQNVVAGI